LETLGKYSVTRAVSNVQGFWGVTVNS